MSQNNAEIQAKSRQKQGIYFQRDNKLIIFSSCSKSHPYIKLSPDKCSRGRTLKNGVILQMKTSSSFVQVGFQKHKIILGCQKDTHNVFVGKLNTSEPDYSICINKNSVQTRDFQQIDKLSYVTVVTQKYIFRGIMRYNSFQGYGALIFLYESYKLIYKGSFKQSRFSGYGICLTNNYLVCGSWRNDQFNGQITRICNSHLLIGSFHEGSQFGYSVQVINPHYIFKGVYINGQQRGVGLSILANGTECGDYQDMQLHGQFTQYAYSNDKTLELRYKYNKTSQGYVIQVKQQIWNQVLLFSRYQGHSTQGLCIHKTYNKFRYTDNKDEFHVELIVFNEVANGKANQQQGSRFHQSFTKEQQNSNQNQTDFQFQLVNYQLKDTIELLKNQSFSEEIEERYLYTGEFENQLIQGKGCKRTIIDQTEGNFVDGQPHGYVNMQMHDTKKHRGMINGKYMIKICSCNYKGLIQDLPLKGMNTKTEVYELSQREYFEADYEAMLFQEDDPYIKQLRERISINQVRMEIKISEDGHAKRTIKTIEGNVYRYTSAKSYDQSIGSFKNFYHAIQNQQINLDYSDHREQYIGESKNGEYHGKGTLITAKYEYNGYFEEGKFQGYGILREDEYTYKGQWYKGKKHGWGIEENIGEGRYEGYFSLNQKIGLGKYIDEANRFIVQGYWLDNEIFKVFLQIDSRFVFLGQYIWDSNETIIGTYIHQNYRLTGVFIVQQHFPVAEQILKDGKWFNYRQMTMYKSLNIDVMNFKDASIYKGRWSDQPVGQGVYIWFREDKQYRHKLFNGSIKAPIPSSTLVQTCESQIIKAIHNHNQFHYKGMWQQGQFNGAGKLTSRRIFYIGQFQNHLFHGKGCLITREKAYIGQWKSGKLQQGRVNSIQRHDLSDDDSEVSLYFKK